MADDEPSALYLVALFPRCSAGLAVSEALTQSELEICRLEAVRKVDSCVRRAPRANSLVNARPV